MSEKTIITCDGCGRQTEQALVSMFIDGRYLSRTMPIGQSKPNGNYHCCTLACLLSFATKVTKEQTS